MNESKITFSILLKICITFTSFTLNWNNIASNISLAQACNQFACIVFGNQSFQWQNMDQMFQNRIEPNITTNPISHILQLCPIAHVYKKTLFCVLTSSIGDNTIISGWYRGYFRWRHTIKAIRMRRIMQETPRSTAGKRKVTWCEPAMWFSQATNNMH